MQFLKALIFTEYVDDLSAGFGTGVVAGCFGDPVEENVGVTPIRTVSLEHVEYEVVVEVEAALVESEFHLFCGFVSSELEKVLDQ